MEQILYKCDDFKVGSWVGGSVKELAIFPHNAQYLNRDFIWRISTYDMEAEEATFPRLADYDRILVVTEGEAVLSYEDERISRLAELEQDSFDGQWKTTCFGKVKSFDLAVRKGSQGYVDVLFPEKESRTFPVPAASEAKNQTHAFFCLEGYCLVSSKKGSTMVKPGQILILEYEDDEPADYSLMGEGKIIRSMIFFNDMEELMGPETIPAEKPSFDDFRCCIYLANTQFKWAPYIVKSLREIWFTQQLSKAIKKIEKFYIPTLVFFIIAMITGILVMKHGGTDGQVILAILIWFVIDCLLISPLIYMCTVPKPVRKHMKKVSQLTPYEQRIREEELGRNERLEKIMKKYKNSGKNLGRDE